jgi:hypothetical protein
MALTAAWVNMFISDNATWQDAFQFGTVGDTSWSFTGQNFKCDIKASRNDLTPLLELLSTSGAIVVQDPVNRILNFNVPDATIQSDLPCGEYVYDLIMYDASSPPIRVQLMQGKLFVKRGVTED